MVLNLLANAVKFTPAGGVITLSVARTPGGELALGVTDTGVGMREEDIPLAQQAFRQINNSLTRHREGVGLGLPLVKRLAELHGGRLLMTSVVGKGTTATIELPSCIFGALECGPRLERVSSRSNHPVLAFPAEALVDAHIS